MLRVGPGGVERIVPRTLRAPERSTAGSTASSDGPSVGKKVLGTLGSLSVGATATPNVLSFKTVMGKAPPTPLPSQMGAAPWGSTVDVAVPMAKTVPRPRAATSGGRSKTEVKEEEDTWEEVETEETTQDWEVAEEEWDGLEEEKEEKTATFPKQMVAKAKKATQKKVPRPSTAEVLPPRNVTPKEEPLGEPGETVLENEDWLKQFNEKWDEAMSGVDQGKPEHRPTKRPRLEPEQETSDPGNNERVSSKAKLGPRQPSGPPPKHLTATAVAPITPGGADATVPSVASASEARLLEEHPEWADRCTLEAAKPGQPQRLTISMAEVGLGDEGLQEWCRWMEQRLQAARPGTGGSSARFRAGTIDLSENSLSVSSVKVLCAMLEKQGVRSDVLRLTGNDIGNEGVRCIAKFLTSLSQAPAVELHLSRNKVNMEGVKWLIGSLAMHPGYPVWNNETQRYVPLWLKIEKNNIKAGTGYGGLVAACTSLSCSVCTGVSSGDMKCGPRQCVNVGCCDELKHNCVAHLVGGWHAPEGAAALPSPVPHPRPLFAPPGRGAPKAPPSNVEEPVREEPRVIYEDDDLAVVLKPAGWSCLPKPRGVDPAWARLKPLARRKQVGELMMQTASAPPLQAWLLLHFGADPNCDAARDQASDRGLAHRLDLDTSGPILVGKTLRGYEHARKQVLAGLLKDYLALVHGAPPTERGECVAPIDASAYAEKKQVQVDAGGQAATTVWEVIAEYESPDQRGTRYTLVHCRVGTLRTHQIRAHMQHIGHPLVGDRLYGASDPPAFCQRTFLHAFRVGFFNLKGQACIESCSLQTVPDLWSALGRLRKVGGIAMNGCGAPGL